MGLCIVEVILKSERNVKEAVEVPAAGLGKALKLSFPNHHLTLP